MLGGIAFMEVLIFCFLFPAGFVAWVFIWLRADTMDDRNVRNRRKHGALRIIRNTHKHG